MVRSLIVLSSGTGLMAAFCAILMQWYAFTFDHYFFYVPLGSALLGAGIGVALFQWRNRKISAYQGLDSGVQWLSVAALAMAGCMVALLYLPIGPIYLFLVLTGIMALPFLCWVMGACLMCVTENPRSLQLQMGVLVGVVVGLLLVPVLLDALDGAIRAGWALCILLGVLVLLRAGRQSLVFVIISAIMVIGLSVYQVNTTRHALPPWQAGSPHVIKPILGALASGRHMTSRPVHWSAEARIDLLESASKTGGHDWLLTNATAPVPVVMDEKLLSWWRERFPLVDLPLLLNRPGSLLSIGPMPGPEVRIAELLGVPSIHAYAYNRSAEAFATTNATVETGAGIREALRMQKTRYDLVFLPITHPSRAGWVGSNAVEKDLFTSEAMAQYWSLLKDGGMLAITTRDELIYVRALMTLWGMLEAQDTADDRDFSKRVWGLRLVKLAPYKGSYQYLAIAIKGSQSQDQTGKLREIVNQMPVEILFGPGMKALQPYSIFRKVKDYGAARGKFTRVFSRQIKALVDMRGSTDLRPYFFHVIRDAHPYMKWLFTCCLVAFIPLLIFVLPSCRCLDAPCIAYSPPLPVLLIYFIALGGGMVLTTVGVMQRITLWLDESLLSQMTLLAAIVSGLGLGALLCKRYFYRTPSVSAWAPLVVITLLGMVYWLYIDRDVELVGLLGGKIWLIMLITLCLMLGVGSGISHYTGLHRISGHLPVLTPWIWITLGTSMLAGVVLANWVARLWGWDMVWEVAVCCYLLVFGIGHWAQFLITDKSDDR